MSATSKKNIEKNIITKGFSGLSSLASDINITNANPISEKPRLNQTQSSTSCKDLKEKSVSQSQRKSNHAPLQRSGKFNIVRWLFGSGVAAVVIIWSVTYFNFNQSTKQHEKTYDFKAIAERLRQQHNTNATPIENIRPLSKVAIQEIQRQLNVLGYEAGGVDGILGRKTHAAISAFQKDNRLPVDGIASKELLFTLKNASFKKEQSDLAKKSPLLTTKNVNTDPIKTGYIETYKKLRTHGLSTVTIDNTRNSSSVIAKLFYIAGNKTEPIRVISIMPYDFFTIENIQPGKYDIRYEVLDTALIYKSDPFFLEEQSTISGTRFSNITMTLFTVKGGNMQMKHISRSEFE